MADSISDALLPFPPGFLWGTATSAHQIEGHNTNNDWWDWEQTGHVRGGVTSGAACDHYNLYSLDWALAQSLGQNAHRLSLEWSRIEPLEGQWSDAELDHYRKVLTDLRSHGLEPMVTLHHFTNPRWLAAKGGWSNPAVVRYFLRYVAHVMDALGDLCRRWVTINEPMVYFHDGYMTHLAPPSRGGVPAGLRAVRNMLRAHARAFQLIHGMQPAAEVGLAHNVRLFEPAGPRSLGDRLAAGLEDRTFNQAVLWALVDGYLRLPLGRGENVPELGGSLDFIGLNYYARDTVQFTLRRPTAVIARNFARPGAQTDLFGWEVYPQGLGRVVADLARYGKPIYVTENGIADDTDALRPAFVVRSVAALRQAMQAGADVRGYFHWTLVDNFEWAEGYSKPFGLAAVDRETQARTVKRSGLVYRDICQANGLTKELAQTYAPELLA